MPKPFIRKQPTADVKRVLNEMPAGCTVEHRANGLRFTMGVKDGNSFWMMQLEPQRKGKVAAADILRDYKRVAG